MGRPRPRCPSPFSSNQHPPVRGSSSADGHEETLIRALLTHAGAHGGTAPGAPPDVGGAIPVEVQPTVDPAVHEVDTNELPISLTMIGRHTDCGLKTPGRDETKVLLTGQVRSNLAVQFLSKDSCPSGLRSVLTAEALGPSGERRWLGRPWRCPTGPGYWLWPTGWTPRPRPHRECGKWRTGDSRAG